VKLCAPLLLYSLTLGHISEQKCSSKNWDHFAHSVHLWRRSHLFWGRSSRLKFWWERRKKRKNRPSAV